MDHGGHDGMDHGGMDMGGDQCSMNVCSHSKDLCRFADIDRCSSPGLRRTFALSSGNGA